MFRNGSNGSQGNSTTARRKRRSTSPAPGTTSPACACASASSAESGQSAKTGWTRSPEAAAATSAFPSRSTATKRATSSAGKNGQSTGKRRDVRGCRLVDARPSQRAGDSRERTRETGQHVADDRRAEAGETSRIAVRAHDQRGRLRPRSGDGAFEQRFAAELERRFVDAVHAPAGPPASTTPTIRSISSQAASPSDSRANSASPAGVLARSAVQHLRRRRTHPAPA